MLWAIAAFYAFSRLGQLFPEHIPILATTAAHVLAPLLFTLLHGSRIYGVRGIAVFVGLCVVVGNVFENLSIATGFPFGHYYFTDVMGPKILQVPILLGLAYVGMGYISWIVGSLLVGPRARKWTVPAAAMLAMVAWDLAMDPIWANAVHAWVWLEGGAYFGVPLSNFFGWSLTVWVIYQFFALWLERQPDRPMARPEAQLAVVFYAITALGNMVIARPPGTVVVDHAGVPWPIAGVYGASALVSIFLMGGLALLAWWRAPQSTTR